MPAKFRVRLRKSPVSHTARTRGTVRALGLHRIGQTVEIPDNAQTRGMARSVAFLLEVEETNEGTGRAASGGTSRPPASAGGSSGKATRRTNETS